ncbi:hypothetical protein L7F22_031395 [Adiantum nelumboides]|nr:hypothetical protein [Adiantum nelumboides]
MLCTTDSVENPSSLSAKRESIPLLWLQALARRAFCDMCSVGTCEVVCSPRSPLSCAVVLTARTRTACSPVGLSRLDHFTGSWSSRASRRLQQTRGVVLRAEGGGGEGGAQEKEDVKSKSFFINRLGVQALICVLTLGFLDAGYSGDWSRIGVLSKEVESGLRVGAYGVLWSLGKQSSEVVGFGRSAGAKKHS